MSTMKSCENCPLKHVCAVGCADEQTAHHVSGLVRAALRGSKTPFWTITGTTLAELAETGKPKKVGRILALLD